MDEKDKEALQLLTDLLSIPSVNGRDDEGAAAEYLCRYFRDAGIEANVERIDQHHANVSAWLEGEEAEAPAVIWNGHLDTVPYGSVHDWHTDPAVPVQAEGRMYARGASDMKSGLCAMAAALCRMKRSGRKPKRNILFLGTCDEEKGGMGAIAAREKYKLCEKQEILIGEPTGLRAGTAQKGCLWLELQIDGKTSHGAYPEQGCSAVMHGFAVAERIKRYVERFEHPLLGHATANITEISGGTAPNMIPEQCRILVDIRMTPDLSTEKLLQKVDEFIIEEEKPCSGMLKITRRVINNRRSFALSTESKLCRDLYRCLRDQDLPCEQVGISFFTDASLLAESLPEAEVLLFGPGDPAMAHKPDEYVAIDRYMKAIDVLEEMLLL